MTAFAGMMPTRPPPFHGFTQGAAPCSSSAMMDCVTVLINGGYFHGRLRVKERMYLLLAIDARDAPKRSEQQRQVYENGGEDLM